MITRAGNLYCAASINALADLTVHFIRYFTAAISPCMLSATFLTKRANPTNKSLIAKTTLKDATTTKTLFKSNSGCTNNTHRRSGCLADVAKQFGMSLRNFNRRFLAATGKTPLQYLQGLRIEEGRDLLNNSNLSIAGYEKKSAIKTASISRVYFAIPLALRQEIIAAVCATNYFLSIKRQTKKTLQLTEDSLAKKQSGRRRQARKSASKQIHIDAKNDQKYPSAK
ncbi:MAG: helix-turn-helix domain-containing protein [Pseudomonadales bacterium]